MGSDPGMKECGPGLGRRGDVEGIDKCVWYLGENVGLLWKTML